MHQPDSQKSAQTHRQRRTGPMALLVLGPLALGLLVSGCETIEDATDYVGDLFSYVEDDDQIFGENAVPGSDEPYRSLSEVPNRAPAMSSAEERAALTAGLVADREEAQQTADALRAPVDPEEPMTQVRAVYRPAEGADEPAPANDG